MKTILTAAAVAALLVSFAPVATAPAFADGITLKRGGSTSTRTSRNRAGGEEPGEEAPADTGDSGNDDGASEEVADSGDDDSSGNSGSGWSWGGGRNDDDEPSVRDNDRRETIVLSRDTSRHQRRWKRRHNEPKRTIWILNW